MIASLLALALFPMSFQNKVVPIEDRGITLFHRCQATIRLTDSVGNAAVDADPSQRCLDYMDGFIEGTIASHGPCISDASLGTLVRVYVAFMDKNPQYLDELKGIGVWRAFHDAYPCPAK